MVLILADDLGWNDVGFHGSEIETPHLDELAAQGVRLNRFYVQSSCSPTRTELMTGRSAASLGVVAPFSKLQPKGVPLTERFLPQYFQEAGYQTFLVGKWHLGFRQAPYRPNNRGFDHFYGHVTGGIGYWDHVHGGGLDWQRNGSTVREDGYATHLMRDEAVRLIRERDTEKPFLLYLALNAPHLPGEAPEQAVERYAPITNKHRRLHAGMVSEMDSAIGAVINALRAQDILDNTVIWFMSDNGGLNPSYAPAVAVNVFATLDEWFGERELPLTALEFARVNLLHGAADNTPLRGGKQSVYEGGIRVPSLIYWRGTLNQRLISSQITVLDVLPTLLASAKLPPPANKIDGTNQWPVIQHGAQAQQSPYHVSGIDGQALINFPWKLVLTRNDKPELYRLDTDPMEQQDIASNHPEQAALLRDVLSKAPRAEPLNLPIWRVAWDPDFFGGAEDRAPWADQFSDSPPTKP